MRLPIQLAATLGVSGVLGLTLLLSAAAEEKRPAPPTTPAEPIPVPEPSTPDIWLARNFKQGFQTHFPYLAPPVFEVDNQNEVKKYHEACVKLCPRIIGDTEIAAQPNDDAGRILLKAHLYLTKLEIQQLRLPRFGCHWGEDDRQIRGFDCLRDIHEITSELFADDPKTRIAWLEETVIVAKEFERHVYYTTKAGQDPPQKHNLIARERLKIEALLWKAMNSHK